MSREILQAISSPLRCVVWMLSGTGTAECGISTELAIKALTADGWTTHGGERETGDRPEDEEVGRLRRRPRVEIDAQFPALGSGMPREGRRA